MHLTDSVHTGDTLNIKATCIHCCVYVICSQLNSLFCPNKLFGIFIANWCLDYLKHVGIDAGPAQMAADARRVVRSFVPASVDAN